MQVEKIQLKNFAARTIRHEHVVDNVTRQNYVLPSLVPETRVETAKPDEPPPPPAITEADVKNAEQEAYRRGFMEGSNEGRMQAESEQAEIDRVLVQNVEQLAAHIGGLMEEYNRFVAEQREQLPPLALAIARKVAGKALDINPLPLLEEMVTSCLERLVGEPHITVTVNERVSDALEKRLISHFDGNTDPGEITIQGSGSIGMNDCRIDWQNGFAERNTTELWRQAESIINDMVSAERQREIVAPPTEEQTPQPPQHPEGA